MSVPRTLTHGAARLRAADCDLDELVRIVAQRTDPADFPLAADVVDNVVVYDAARLRTRCGGRTARRRSRPSWCAR